MPKQKISKEKSIRRTKIFTELIISAVIVASCAYVVIDAVRNTQVVSSSPYFDSVDIPVPSDEDIEADPNQTIYESFSVATTDKFKGDLILVNEDHQYFGGDENLVGVTEMNYETDRAGIFGAADEETHGAMTVLDIVYEPMAEMVCDFYDLTGISNLIIYGGYRSTSFQQELYEQDLAQTGDDDSTRVAKPGFSEHETGYAFDFTTYPDYDYQGTDEYEWFTDNSYKYGFVLRYPEDKTDITKIQYEPWHFRYVGLPHAYYMTKNGICLEEYIELLRKHSYADEHLEFTDDGGKEYEVYFVASDDSSETTGVPVPAGVRYEISGNNVDGFIVTVYKGEAPLPVQPPTEPETDEDEYIDDEELDGYSE